MIKAECAVFFLMLVGGGVASAVATLLLTLGGASKVWRALFDFLTPLAVGAIFFISLSISSGGSFRLYSLFAFAAGAGGFCLLYRRLRPILKVVLKKLIVPIKSLENAISERYKPIAERRAEKRAEKEERRRAKRAFRAEKRKKKTLEKVKRRSDKKRKSKRPTSSERRKISSSPHSPIGQSH